MAGHSCEFVAAVLNPEMRSRDRISKLECGVSGIDMFGYLRLMWFYRDLAPSHPAVVLAKRLLPPEALRRWAKPGDRRAPPPIRIRLLPDHPRLIAVRKLLPIDMSQLFFQVGMAS
jgi:hypothetical protein